MVSMLLPSPIFSSTDKSPNSQTLENLIRLMRRSEAKFLAEIVETLESHQFDCSAMSLLAEGSKSSVFLIVGPTGNDLVLKISSPPTIGWEPDWGRRPYDALVTDITGDGDSVKELESGCFWYVQEYGKTYERGDNIPDYLWEEFQELIGDYACNLFVDNTELVKQLAVVERDGIEKLVVTDYAAFCAQDKNPLYSQWAKSNNLFTD